MFLFSLVVVLVRVLDDVLLAVCTSHVAFRFSAREPRVYVGGGLFRCGRAMARRVRREGSSRSCKLGNGIVNEDAAYTGAPFFLSTMAGTYADARVAR